MALLSSCAKRVPSESVAGYKVKWNELALSGKTLSLIHPTKLRIFTFKEDFTAVATIGEDGADGDVAGPVLFWGILGNALVISKSPLVETAGQHGRQAPFESDAIAVLTQPTLDGDVLTVLSQSEEPIRYRLTKRD